MGVSGKTSASGGKKGKGSRAAMLVIAAIGVCLAAGVWTRINTSRFESETIVKTHEHLMNIAKSQSHKIEEFIYHVQGEMEMLSKNPAIIKHNKERLTQTQVVEMGGHIPGLNVFNHIDEHFEGDLDSFYRIDKDGIVLARIPFKDGKIGDDYSHKPGVRYVMENKEPCVTDVFTTSSGTQAITICHPIFDEEEFAGVVRAVVYIETLHGLIRRTKVGQGDCTWLVDDKGVMLAHPRPERMGKDAMIPPKEAFPDHDWTDMEIIVDEMKSGGSGVGAYQSACCSIGGLEITKKLVAFAPVSVGSSTWSLAISTSHDEIAAPVAKHARNNLLGAGFLFLLFGAGGFGLYRAEKKETELEMLSQMAEALEERERRFRSIAQTASDGIITIDSSGVIAFWNDAACKIFGYSTDEALGKPITLIMPERFHEAHEDGMKHLRDTGESQVVRHTVELIGLRKDGEEFPLELSLAQWQTKEGSFCTGIVRDITERKRAEEELSRIRAAVDDASDAVMIMDGDGKAVYLNTAFGHMFGHTIESINRAGFESLYADRDASDEVHNRVGAGASWEGEARMISAQGGECEAYLRVSPILNNEFDVIGALLMCADITDRKRIEAEQIDRQKLQAIVELAGAACHEFNQPLQVVSGHTELMLIRMSQDHSLRRQIEAVKEQVDRMVRITRKLGNITSYETRSYFEDIRIIDIDKASGSVQTNPPTRGAVGAGARGEGRGEA
jgi:PAS domain S-box-containing protein